MSAFLTKPSMGKAFSNEIRAVATKNRSIIDDENMEELKEAFTLFDTNHNGTIDLREFKAAMRALGYDVTKQQCIEMFREGADKTAESVLNFNDFCKLLAPKLKSKDSRDEVMKVYELFDFEQQGYITFKNLKKIAQDVGENLTDQELHEMIAEADKTGDGHINFQEFFRVMSKNCNDPLNEFDSDDEKPTK